MGGILVFLKTAAKLTAYIPIIKQVISGIKWVGKQIGKAVDDYRAAKFERKQMELDELNARLKKATTDEERQRLLKLINK